LIPGRGLSIYPGERFVLPAGWPSVPSPTIVGTERDAEDTLPGVAAA
jgi:hypothetical protein